MQNLEYTRKKSTIKLKQMILDEVRTSENLKEYALWRAKRKPNKKNVGIININTQKTLREYENAQVWSLL